MRGGAPTAGAFSVTRKRALCLAGLAALWALAVCVRLVDLQVLRREVLVERARKQHERVVEIPAPRGRILDRDGRPLAESVEVPSIYADPSAIEDPRAAARSLASLLDRRAGELTEALRSDRSFVWLARRVTPQVADAVNALGISGIGTLSETQRFYPNGRLAAQVLGIVGVDGNGLAGVEYRYDDQVKGVPGRMLSVRDARGQGILMYLQRPSSSGGDLRLTIDSVIQYHAEIELDRAMRRSRAAWGSVVAMDPATGDILAMATRPSFNPNAYSGSTPERRRNRSVMDAYEPGSTFKVVTAAAALEAGLVRVDDRIDCGNGFVVVAGKRIRDHKPFDVLTFADVIANSSNGGAIQVGGRVPAQAFYDTVRAFGFGSRTGVGLPGENPGLLRDPGAWSGVSQASMSIGQEIAATPLQVLRAVAAIAAGGTLPQPRIVLDGDPAGDPAPGERIISARTAATINALLERVVDTGTGTLAAIPGYRVAGKTGTAQKAEPGGGYGPLRVASFAGYVPSRHPRLAMIVVLDSPQGDHDGGLVAAPVFARIALPALRHLGVSPEQGDALERPGAVPGPPPAPADAGGPAPALRTADGKPVVPDLRGSDLRVALAMLARAGFQAQVEGSGQVVRQAPAAGEVLPPDGVVRLLLSPTARPAASGPEGRRAHSG